MILTEKYKPKSKKDLFNPEAERIESFLNNPKKGRLLLLVGPTGCGKTSTVLAVARDFEVLELNASLYRNRNSIREIMGPFCSQMSLFVKKKLVLLDEVDTFSGRFDLGGLAEVVKIVESSSTPVIATANSIDEEKLSPLLKRSDIVVFQTPSWSSITKILKKICDGEGIKYSEDQLKRIAIASQGDIRAAINDLHSLLSKELILDFGPMDREKTNEVSQGLSLIFKGSDPLVIREVLANLDENLTGELRLPIVYSGENALSYWLEENTPLEYSREDTAKAFDSLSLADIYRGRIIKRGYWRFLSYISDFLGPGVALSKKEKNPKPTQYKIVFRSPKRNPRLWWLSSATKKSIAEKIAKKTHTSSRQALKDLSFTKHIVLQCSDFFDFEEKEINFLKK